jgi:hypothetical protein
MDPEDRKTGVFVALPPGAQIGQRPEAVDAREVPDVEQYHPPAQAAHGEGIRRIEPGEWREFRRADEGFLQRHPRILAGFGRMKVVGPRGECRPCLAEK